jgi:hypothetical protein
MVLSQTLQIGRYKDGKERREKTLPTVMTGSENDCVEVLAAISAGILFSHRSRRLTK